MEERKKIIYKKEGLEGVGNQRERKKTGKQGNVVGDREKKKKEKYRI